jgi:hypothetical protein
MFVLCLINKVEYHRVLSLFAFRSSTVHLERVSFHHLLLSSSIEKKNSNYSPQPKDVYNKTPKLFFMSRYASGHHASPIHRFPFFGFLFLDRSTSCS